LPLCVIIIDDDSSTYARNFAQNKSIEDFKFLKGIMSQTYNIFIKVDYNPIEYNERVEIHGWYGIAVAQKRKYC